MSGMKIDFRKCLLCRARGDTVTLFRFPQKDYLKKQWASFCSMDPNLLTSKDCLCIKHFSPDQIVPKLPTRKKTKLRRSAVPSRLDVAPDSDSRNTANSRIVPTSQGPISKQKKKRSAVKSAESANSRQSMQSPVIIDVLPINHEILRSERRETIIQPQSPGSTSNHSTESADICDLVEFKRITVFDVDTHSKLTGKRTVRYVGDVTPEHLSSQEDAVKYFSMAKKALDDSKKKVRFLQKQVARLKRRVQKYEDILKQSGGSVIEEVISDDDFSWPLDEDPTLEILVPENGKK